MPIHAKQATRDLYLGVGSGFTTDVMVELPPSLLGQGSSLTEATWKPVGRSNNSY